MISMPAGGRWQPRHSSDSSHWKRCETTNGDEVSERVNQPEGVALWIRGANFEKLCGIKQSIRDKRSVTRRVGYRQRRIVSKRLRPFFGQPTSRYQPVVGDAANSSNYQRVPAACAHDLRQLDTLPALDKTQVMSFTGGYQSPTCVPDRRDDRLHSTRQHDAASHFRRADCNDIHRPGGDNTGAQRPQGYATSTHTPHPRLDPASLAPKGCEPRHFPFHVALIAPAAHWSLYLPSPRQGSNGWPADRAPLPLPLPLTLTPPRLFSPSGGIQNLFRLLVKQARVMTRSAVAQCGGGPASMGSVMTAKAWPQAVPARPGAPPFAASKLAWWDKQQETTSANNSYQTPTVEMFSH